MKKSRSLRWTMIRYSAAVLAAAVASAVIITNLTLRSIEINRPHSIIADLFDMDLVLEDLAETVAAAQQLKNNPGAEAFSLLRSRVETLDTRLSEIRSAHGREHGINEISFHAFVAQAVADLQTWISKGAPGYEPESDTTIEAVHSKASETYRKAKTLISDSRASARKVIEEQRRRVDRLLLTVNLLFLLTFATVLLIIFRHMFNRKRAENELRQQRDLLNSLIENILLGVTVWDHDGKLLRINRRFTEITGYSCEDISNLDDWFAKAYPDSAYREKVKKCWKNDVNSKETAVKDFQVVCKNGDVKDIEFRTAFLRDSRALVTLTDITERKRVEANIAQSERRFRANFENAPVGMAIIDRERRFLEVNSKLCRILGYEPEEMLGKSFNAFTHPEDRPGGRKRWYALLRRQVEFNQAEKRYVHKDGRVLWTLVNNTLVTDNQGEPLYFLSHLIDITDRKKALEEKVRLEAQLQKAQKLEAVGTLAGGIAHDFNNILMGIQGRASLLRLEIEKNNPSHEHIDCIEEYISGATDLTKQLLGFARGGKYKVKAVDLNKVIQSSAAMFGRTRKEIQIKLNLTEPIQAVEADQGQIEQVLLNLYVNAWQAMPEGGSLFLETENVTLDSDYCKAHQIQPGAYVKISLTDSGVGIDKKEIHRIFDPFFTTKEKSRGTGLGLASAYGIIKNHEGIITVYSEKGKGTTFNIYLPASEKKVIEDIPAKKRERKGHEKILLVDDELMIIEVGRKMLERLGYKVITAMGGREAIDLYADNGKDIDLVILDLIMPVMDGSKTFEGIKRIDPGAKILLSSGYAINGQPEELIKKGCDGFIQKPFKTHELSDKIRMVLDKGR